MRVSILLLSALTLSLTAAAVAAPPIGPVRPAPRFPGPQMDLERRVYELEATLHNQGNALYDMSRRVEDLERRLSLPALPPPGMPVETFCMITDTGFSRAFLGNANNRLDAEFAARTACEKGTHPTYCTNPNKLKCDDTNGLVPNQSFVCVVTDTGFSRTFRGEGRTAIAAEAAAKQACEKATHPTYCAPAEVRCDSIFR